MKRKELGIFKSVTFLNEVTKYVNNNEFNKILDQYKSIYYKFYQFAKNNLSNTLPKLDEHAIKKNFNKGRNISLVYSYGEMDSDKLYGDELDRYMMNNFMKFAKENGFRVHHNVMEDVTYATESAQYPDIMMCFATPNYGRGAHKALIIFGCNDDFTKK